LAGIVNTKKSESRVTTEIMGKIGVMSAEEIAIE
jgi:hypothetical protein